MRSRGRHHRSLSRDRPASLANWPSEQSTIDYLGTRKSPIENLSVKNFAYIRDTCGIYRDLHGAVVISHNIQVLCEIIRYT